MSPQRQIPEDSIWTNVSFEQQHGQLKNQVMILPVGSEGEI